MNFKELTQFLKENLSIKDYLNITENITNSPIRDDFNPSFFITKYNTWIDYGTGERGDIFDLIQQMENTTDFKNTVLKAKEIFRDLYGYYPGEREHIKKEVEIKKETKASFNSSEKKKKKNVSSIEIVEINEINDFNLINYFTQERGIDKQVLKTQTQQLTLHNKKTNKTFKAVGFLNNAGGYELRNKLFKGSIGKKHISTRNYDSKKQNIVLLEGFTDYLSLLTILNNKEYYTTNEIFKTLLDHIKDISFIILNSIVNLQKIGPFVKDKTIITLLDNDDAGIETTNKIKKEYDDVIDLTPELLRGSNKDINDYLLQLKKETELKEFESNEYLETKTKQKQQAKRKYTGLKLF